MLNRGEWQENVSQPPIPEKSPRKEQGTGIDILLIVRKVSEKNLIPVRLLCRFF